MDKGNNITLLLVEDEVLIAMEKQQELGRYGYNIIHAMTGEAAVSIIKEKNDIDMVLMDLDLGGGIDGTTAAEIILEDRDIPIIFVSSHTEPEVVKKTEKIASYGYVVKSSGISILNSSIKAAFELFNNSQKSENNNYDTRNKFTVEGSSLSIQANSLTNYSAVSALNDAVGRVKSYQMLYEKLLLSDDYNVASVKQYLDDLIDEIVSLNFFSKNVEISVEKEIDEIKLESKQLVSFGIIINELLSNVFKYAFVGKASGLIQVTLTEKMGNITFTIQDDGKGLPNGFDLEKQTGFGLLLVKMLTMQFEGEFTIENNNGVRSVLKFSI